MSDRRQRRKEARAARAERETRRRRTLVVLTAGGAVVVLVVAAVIAVTVVRRPAPRILFSELTDTQAGFAAEHLRELDAEFMRDDTEFLTGDASADLLIAPLGRGITAEPSELAPVPPENFDLLPVSVRAVGRIDGEEKLLPVALDHVELLYRHGAFAERGVLVDGRVRSLDGLETVAADFVEPGFFPVVVAGGEDTAMLDFVSVLTLSLGGVDAYLEFLGYLRVNGVNEDTLFTRGFDNAWNLQEIIRRMQEWRASGIIHPQWTRLEGDDVMAFAEAQRAVAVVMRLSTHRSWPVYVLRRWRTSPFPYEDPRAAGTGLVAPVFVGAVASSSPWREEALEVLPRLVEADFQTEVVQRWRLAPVNSTAEALDRESAEVRFWAAASREILPSLADALPPETAAALAEAVRGRVGR
ncbi:MAG: hypothetical protein GVY14_01920 [Spirochaetes bacterium]|nr:hypothetical protein [Spirochaetota bacterium]